MKPRGVEFTHELIGGHGLRVVIPGLGTVPNYESLAVWRQMAELLVQIGQSVARQADAMAADMSKGSD